MITKSSWYMNLIYKLDVTVSYFYLVTSSMSESQSIISGFSDADHVSFKASSWGYSTRYSGKCFWILVRIVRALYSNLLDETHNGTILWASTSYTSTKGGTLWQTPLRHSLQILNGEKSTTSVDALHFSRRAGMLSSGSPCVMYQRFNNESTIFIKTEMYKIERSSQPPWSIWI